MISPRDYALYKNVNMSDPVEYIEARTWDDKFPMGNVRLSTRDANNGSPKLGDMIARRPDDPNDQWLISKKFFDLNYTRVSAFEETTGEKGE